MKMRSINSFLGDEATGPFLGDFMRGIVNVTQMRFFSGKLNHVFDRNFYFWWSDVPFYRDSDIDSFFEFIGFKPKYSFVETIGRNTFDHYVYGCWLIYAKNFSSIYTSDFGIQMGSSLEEEYDVEEYRQILNHYRPSWMSNLLYLNITKDEKACIGCLDDIYMLYHIDRGQ